MITKLGILNFQSIEQLAVECGLITVFVGESDSGKSAVVRALHAAAFNDYPTDHVRQGSSHSTVVIATEDGSVQVEKGGGKNTYALQSRTKSHGEPKRTEWERVGREVPDEVVAFLGWRMVELDDGSRFVPSIQRQFDGPFLLDDSPSRVAKVLGSLTNISMLFAAIREGINEERRARKAAADARAQAAEFSEERMATEAEYEKALRAAQRATEAYKAAVTVVEEFVGVERLWMGIEVAEEKHRNAVEALRLAEEKRVEVPDLEAAFAEIVDLEALQKRIEKSRAVVTDLEWKRDEAKGSAEGMATQLQEFMGQLEICPICERPMHS